MLTPNLNNAIESLKRGDPIILLDDHDRENEGDLIYVADLIRPEKIAFMLNHTSGIICLSLTQAHAAQLNLKLMTQNNRSRFSTPFTVSIEAKDGITTGVSAHDRTKTILDAAHCKVDSLVSPGHIFPLIADQHGVLGRPGHTESSIDLSSLAGFNKGAVLAELKNDDGSMMKGEQITSFAEIHAIPIVSIAELIEYRRQAEIHINETANTRIQLNQLGEFHLSHFQNTVTQERFIVLSKPHLDKPIVRIHSSCLTGDLFGSLHCDCQSQLNQALQLISKKGGHLIYMLDQEGRGIGLENKIKAYDLQKRLHLNTIEANQHLNFLPDLRHYHDPAQFLRLKEIKQCYLLTNNPDKITTLKSHGIDVERLASLSHIHSTNCDYLTTKVSEFQHQIEGVLEYER